MNKQTLIDPRMKAQKIYQMATQPETVATEIIKYSPKIFLYRHILGNQKQQTRFVMIGPNGETINSSIELTKNFDELRLHNTSLDIKGRCLTGMQVVRCWNEHGL